MNTVNKKEVVFTTLQSLVVVDEVGVKSFSQNRKQLISTCYDALIAAGVDKHDIKPHLIPSYIQMARMEYLTGKGAYAHHKQVVKKSTVPTIVIPEGAQWKAVNGETIEYFSNRQQAREHVKQNGGSKAGWQVSHI